MTCIINGTINKIKSWSLTVNVPVDRLENGIEGFVGTGKQGEKEV